MWAFFGKGIFEAINVWTEWVLVYINMRVVENHQGVVSISFPLTPWSPLPKPHVVAFLRKIMVSITISDFYLIDSFFWFFSHKKNIQIKSGTTISSSWPVVPLQKTTTATTTTSTSKVQEDWMQVAASVTLWWTHGCKT